MYFFCIVVGLLRELNEYENIITMFLKEGNISAEVVQRIITESETEQGLSAVAIWGQREMQAIENKNLDRQAEVKVIYAYGDVKVIVQEPVGFVREDTKGCLIDSKTAYSLFGTEEAQGFLLSYQDEEYIVRGVLKETEFVLVISPEIKEVEYLNTISVLKHEGQKASAINQELQRQGFLGYSVDITILTGVVKFMAFMYIIILLVSIIFWTEEYCKEREKNQSVSTIKKIRTAKRVVLVFTIGLVIIAFFDIFKLTADNLPTKWSDFEFWGRYFVEKQQEIALLIQKPKNIMEVRYLSKAFEGIGVAAVGLISYAILLVIKSKTGSIR